MSAVMDSLLLFGIAAGGIYFFMVYKNCDGSLIICAGESVIGSAVKAVTGVLVSPQDQAAIDTKCDQNTMGWWEYKACAYSAVVNSKLGDGL